MEMIETMGASPTPIPWGRLYTAADQGIVDAAENNAASFETSRHFEVCKYYILDEHVRVPDMLVISTGCGIVFRRRSRRFCRRRLMNRWFTTGRRGRRRKLRR